MKTKIPVLLIVVMLVACTQMGGIKPFVDMSPKEKATFFMSIYNAQADDYRLAAANPALTEDEKTILRTKKKLMVTVYPLISTYVSYIEAGAVPSPELELQIINLLNQLTSAVITQI